jgi:hypothetical protein
MTQTTFEQPEPDDGRPFDAEPWQTRGMSAEDGRGWWRHRIGPDQALRWLRAGVSEPIDAVRWKIAGVAPDTVREWIYAKIDAREAVTWSELGFSVVEARKHKRAGLTAVQAYGRTQRVHTAGAPPASPAGGLTRAPQAGRTQRAHRAGWAPPSPPSGLGRGGPDPHSFMQTVGRRDPRVVHSYMHRQWFDDEAIAWATHGIEASDALAWKELGLTPTEAERHQERGMSAMQTAKAWWQAGIPFDEVADWIGAGLTPKEAAEQRANGVTAERAAVLRSLRKQR